MKLTFDEKKLLYAYGNPDLALTRKRLYEVAGLTVDPDLNRLVFDFVRKLENESLHLERGTTRCSTSCVRRWSAMPGCRSWRRTLRTMRTGGLRCSRRTKMTNALMPCKLETMIYDCGDGTYSVFTLNPVLQKQLANLAVQHPKMCWNQKK